MDNDDVEDGEIMDSDCGNSPSAENSERASETEDEQDDYNALDSAPRVMSSKSHSGTTHYKKSVVRGQPLYIGRSSGSQEERFTSSLRPGSSSFKTRPFSGTSTSSSRKKYLSPINQDGDDDDRPLRRVAPPRSRIVPSHSQHRKDASTPNVREKVICPELIVIDSTSSSDSDSEEKDQKVDSERKENQKVTTKSEESITLTKRNLPAPPPTLPVPMNHSSKEHSCSTPDNDEELEELELRRSILEAYVKKMKESDNIDSINVQNEKIDGSNNSPTDSTSNDIGINATPQKVTENSLPVLPDTNAISSLGSDIAEKENEHELELYLLRDKLLRDLEKKQKAKQIPKTSISSRKNEASLESKLISCLPSLKSTASNNDILNNMPRVDLKTDRGLKRKEQSSLGLTQGPQVLKRRSPDENPAETLISYSNPTHVISFPNFQTNPITKSEPASTGLSMYHYADLLPEPFPRTVSNCSDSYISAHPSKDNPEMLSISICRNSAVRKVTSSELAPGNLSHVMPTSNTQVVNINKLSSIPMTELLSTRNVKNLNVTNTTLPKSIPVCSTVVSENATLNPLRKASSALITYNLNTPHPYVSSIKTVKNESTNKINHQTKNKLPLVAANIVQPKKKPVVPFQQPQMKFSTYDTGYTSSRSRYTKPTTYNIAPVATSNPRSRRTGFINTRHRHSFNPNKFSINRKLVNSHAKKFPSRAAMKTLNTKTFPKKPINTIVIPVRPDDETSDDDDNSEDEKPHANEEDMSSKIDRFLKTMREKVSQDESMQRVSASSDVKKSTEKSNPLKKTDNTRVKAEATKSDKVKDKLIENTSESKFEVDKKFEGTTIPPSTNKNDSEKTEVSSVIPPGRVTSKQLLSNLDEYEIKVIKVKEEKDVMCDVDLDEARIPEDSIDESPSESDTGKFKSASTLEDLSEKSPQASPTTGNIQNSEVNSSGSTSKAKPSVVAASATLSESPGKASSNTSKVYLLDQQIQTREELELREKLLRATLIRKEVQLSLLSLEKNYQSTRVSTNSLLRDALTKVNKHNAKKKECFSAFRNMQALQRKLRAAEKKLERVVGSTVSTHEEACDAISKAFTMRIKTATAAAYCRKLGDELKQVYSIPSDGAADMLLKIRELFTLTTGGVLKPAPWNFRLLEKQILDGFMARKLPSFFDNISDSEEDSDNERKVKTTVTDNEIRIHTPILARSVEMPENFVPYSFKYLTKSKEKGWRVANVHVAVCPNDLTSVCHNLLCKFQHFKDNSTLM